VSAVSAVSAVLGRGQELAPEEPEEKAAAAAVPEEEPAGRAVSEREPEPEKAPGE
jgi:hypothetical protein